MRLYFFPIYFNTNKIIKKEKSSKILTRAITIQNLYFSYSSVSFLLMSRLQTLLFISSIFSNGITSQFRSWLFILINWSVRWSLNIKTSNTKTICFVSCTNIYNIQLSNKINLGKLRPNWSKWLPVSRLC